MYFCRSMRKCGTGYPRSHSDRRDSRSIYRSSGCGACAGGGETRFLDEYDLDLLTIIRRVYKEPQANRFLASVLPFISANISVPELHKLVLDAFRAFFRRNIRQYTEFRAHPVCFIGSVAYYFADVLREAAEAEECTLGTILKSPMEGLIQFHSK